MAGGQRQARVTEGIREAAAEILHSLKDPRVGFATLIRAEVSGDLRHVKLYVSVLGPEAEQRATMAVLESAKGHVRSEIGRRVRLFYTPEVRFVLDTSMAHGDRIARLLSDLSEQSKSDAPDVDGQNAESATIDGRPHDVRVP